MSVATIPVASIGRVPCARVDTTLTPRQQVALRRVFDGLQAAGENITMGHHGCISSPVKSQNDVIRWFLDRVADAMDVQPADWLKAI